MTSKRKSLNEWSREELLSLPTRDWQADSSYDSVLVLSTRKKHDSGWAMMAIIGVVDGVPVEVASQCSDDVEWIVHENPRSSSFLASVRMDCAYRSSAMHFWSYDVTFKVGCALSSLTIEVCKKA